MKIAVISSSLNPDSASRRMARSVAASYEAKDNVDVDWIDLQENELPLCDGGTAYGHPNTVEMSKRLESADAFVIATPIYNYTIGSALKNLTELVGRGMSNKLVGFLVSAGGGMSYMSVMQYANSLMLDFRVLVLPRFVYATSGDWEDGTLGANLQGRLQEFEADFLSLARKIAN